MHTNVHKCVRTPGNAPQWRGPVKDQRVKLHDRRAVQCPLAVRDDVSDEVSVLTARARVLFRVRKFHYFVNIQKGG